MPELVKLVEILVPMFGGAAIFALLALYRKWWTPWFFYQKALDDVASMKAERDEQTAANRTANQSLLVLTAYFKDKSVIDAERAGQMRRPGIES